MVRMAFRAVLALSCAALSAATAAAAAERTERGQYLVTVTGCGDCHTPGHLLGKPDPTRALAGSEVGFEIPGLGVFHGPNLTPDAATGLGTWTEEQIVAAIRTGKRPDGRMLVPVMPWMSLARLTDADALAIAAYLKSLPAVSNKVPGPFGAADKPTGFVMKVHAPQ